MEPDGDRGHKWKSGLAHVAVPGRTAPLLPNAAPAYYTISDGPRCLVSSARALTDCLASSEIASPSCLADSGPIINQRAPNKMNVNV